MGAMLCDLVIYALNGLDDGAAICPQFGCDRFVTAQYPHRRRVRPRR
jgi:hypothetical protein